MNWFKEKSSLPVTTKGQSELTLRGSLLGLVHLPSDADREKVNADIEDGVLKIEILKSAGAAKKKKEIMIS